MNIRHEFSRGEIVEIGGKDYEVTVVIAAGEMAYIDGQAHTFEQPCVEFQSVSEPRDNFCIEDTEKLREVAEKND